MNDIYDALGQILLRNHDECVTSSKMSELQKDQGYSWIIAFSWYANSVFFHCIHDTIIILYA